MKKLFFASVFALATLTACTNDSREETTTLPQKESQTPSKTAGRISIEFVQYADYNPDFHLMNEQEQKDFTVDAIELIFANSTDPRVTESAQRNVILCHTSYSSVVGDACVYNPRTGYLVHVHWQPRLWNLSHYFTVTTEVGNDIVYTGHVVSQCKCN